jgi:hypothetical protein
MTRTTILAFSCALALVAVFHPCASADEAINVSLKAPLLICQEETGGVRPPAEKGAAAQPAHDLIFFVLAGKNVDGSEIRAVAPRAGEHLKINNRRRTKFLKNIPLWEGSIPEGQSVTFTLSVREQDGNDTAEADLKEAAEIAPKIDNVKHLRDLAKIPVHEILHGENGENDHVGTVIVRLKNLKGKIRLETELGADTRYLKGYASNHHQQRSFQMTGDHSHYELHLAADQQ